MEILYIYARVSTASQATKDLSIPEQIASGIKKAAELGFEHCILKEPGKTATADDFTNRPVMLELLTLITEGKVKHLYVWDQTRLSRNDITKAFISDKLKKNNVTLYTQNKDYDLTRAEDELTLKILEAIEGYESTLRKARFKLGYISANKKGRFLQNVPPFGYRKDENGYLVVDEEEKSIYLLIVELYLNHEYGTNQIAKYLNERGVKTKTSKLLKNGYTLKAGIQNRKKSRHIINNTWNPGTILSLLKNPVYTGERKFKLTDGSFAYVNCEPLISHEIFEAIQRVRQLRAISKTKSDKYFYLLKNTLQCGNCGNSLHGRTKPNRGEYTYRCNSKRIALNQCSSRGINISLLNNLVWKTIKASVYFAPIVWEEMKIEINKVDVTTEINNISVIIKNLQYQKTEVEAKQKKLLFLAINNDFPKERYEEVAEELNTEMSAIDKQLKICEVQIQSFNKQQNIQQSMAVDQENYQRHFLEASDELENLKPYESKDAQLKAHKIIKGTIKNIIVTFVKENKLHEVVVFFHPLQTLDENDNIIEWNFPPKVYFLKNLNIHKSQGLSSETMKYLEDLIAPDTSLGNAQIFENFKVPPNDISLPH